LGALALKGGQPEKVVLACLLHDIAIVSFIRCDHGYWGGSGLGGEDTSSAALFPDGKFEDARFFAKLNAGGSGGLLVGEQSEIQVLLQHFLQTR
jgi:hypothetical protein